MHNEQRRAKERWQNRKGDSVVAQLARLSRHRLARTIFEATVVGLYYLPWKLTYLISPESLPVRVDDSPNFPFGGILVPGSLEGSEKPPNPW